MMLTGTGSMYDFNRKVSFVGDVSVPLDSVALFETNVKIKDPEKSRIAALAILTGINVAAGIICIISPKTCYGSCPTFYINSDDDFHYSDAEGFSNAILPSMEYALVRGFQLPYSECFYLLLRSVPGILRHRGRSVTPAFWLLSGGHLHGAADSPMSIRPSDRGSQRATVSRSKFVVRWKPNTSITVYRSHML